MIVLVVGKCVSFVSVCSATVIMVVVVYLLADHFMTCYILFSR